MELTLPTPAAAPWLAPALWLVVRATLLLAGAALAVLALRRAPASARHLVWGLALAGLLALPALSLLAPHWELPFVRVALPAPPPAGAGWGGAGKETPWGAILLGVWAAGALAVLARYLLAVVGVRVAAARATEVSDPRWRRRVAAAAHAVGVREEVRLLRTRSAAMPMTWGILRPAVLLPAEADGWDEERRRVVLLHELAHVARRDCLWQALASLCAAAYWFHPGVWWAAWRMRVEREQACDDSVLGVGTRASDYAGHLLAVARACRPRPFTAAAAVALVRRSQLEARVLAVLDGARRRGAVPVRAAILAGGVVAVILFPLAAARPDGFVPQEPPLPVLGVVSGGAPARAVPETAPEPIPLGAAEAAPAERRAGVADEPRPPAIRPAPRGTPLPSVEPVADPMVAALVRAAGDHDPEVRRSAVRALGRMDPGAAVEPLLRSMEDVDARVRSAAAVALGELAVRQRPLRPQPLPRDSLAAPSSGSLRGLAPPTVARTGPGGGGEPAAHRPLVPLAEEDTAYTVFSAGTQLERM